MDPLAKKEFEKDQLLPPSDQIGHFYGRVVNVVTEMDSLRYVVTLVCALWATTRTTISVMYQSGLDCLFPSRKMNEVVKKWQEENPDQLPLPPAMGIQVGLRNLGCTCWFNSLIKFMAATDFFDPMLETGSDADKNMLRRDLSDLFIYLRSAQKKHVLNERCLEKYFNRIIDRITKNTDFQHTKFEQCDPSEFLGFLMTYLEFTSDDKPFFLSSDSGKTENEYDSILIPIDIHESIKLTSSEVDLETDIRSVSIVEGKGRKSYFPTYLPSELFCVINRFDYVVREKEGKVEIGEEEKGKESVEMEYLPRKHQNKIFIESGCVSLPIFDEHMGILDTQKYTVVGSIIHRSNLINFGHYVSTELTEENVHQLHDDDEVQTIDGWAEVDAYMLRLKILTDD